MKLINQTKCPNSILVPLIKHAAMAVRTDLTNVTIKVKQGRSKTERMCGVAFRDKHGIQHGFEVTLAKCNYCEFDLAGQFWTLLAHELGHIHDYQAEDNGAKLEWKYWKTEHSQRLMRHDSRPQEIRADGYIENAADRMLSGEIEKGTKQGLALAIWFANDKMKRDIS